MGQRVVGNHSTRNSKVCFNCLIQANAFLAQLISIISSIFHFTFLMLTHDKISQSLQLITKVKLLYVKF